MATDESFKRPGAIPFKWEIRPGVPKTQLHDRHESPSRNLQRLLVHHHNHLQTQKHQLSCPNTPRKHDTPPHEIIHRSRPEPVWTRPSRSAPQTPLRRSSSRSRSVEVEPATIVRRQPEIVGQGCSFSPNLLMRGNYNKKIRTRRKQKLSSDSDCSSDVESVSRLSSASSRRSVSSLSTSLSSHWSSPRGLDDSYWAGFGLF